MTKATDPEFLDSLATAYFKTGHSRKAVETEQKALDILSANSEKATSETRKKYEANLGKFKKTSPLP